MEPTTLYILMSAAFLTILAQMWNSYTFLDATVKMILIATSMFGWVLLFQSFGYVVVMPSS